MAKNWHIFGHLAEHNDLFKTTAKKQGKMMGKDSFLGSHTTLSCEIYSQLPS